MKSHLEALLSPRDRNSHKGLYGQVLIVGGGLGMPGAVVLAAQAALRVGAGSVTVGTWPDYAKQAIPNLPEVMIHGLVDSRDLIPLLEKATVCILGPGLGEGEWAHELYHRVVASQLPLVMDAGALRLLAASPSSQSNWVLTPHPGEAAALLNCTTEEVQQDRVVSVTRLQQRFGGTVVLKGQGSLVLDPSQSLTTCTEGNPGMATAGMGDVLSGVVGGLMAQGLTSEKAARLGVFMHAKAADYVAGVHGERGLLASDLMPFLHQLANPMMNSCRS